MRLVIAGTINLNVVVPILTAAVTGFFAWYVQAWRLRREASDKATQTLRLYRDPLLRAAFDLQSRLYNISARAFLIRYWTGGNEEQHAYARWSTLWLFGQYLGWVEILRREVQYLDLGSRAANRRLQRRLNEVSAALASDSRGGADSFIVFRSDQRAIGEFMVIVRADQPEGRPDCLGYSEFTDKLAALEAASGEGPLPSGASVVMTWAARFTRDLDASAASAQSDTVSRRLANIQRRLIDLIDLLDGDRLRYPHLNFRGRLPAGEGGGSTDGDRIAFFIWPWDDPWAKANRWGSAFRMKSTVEAGETRTFRGRKGPLGRHLQVKVERKDGTWLSVSAARIRWNRAKPIDGSLRARRCRAVANGLLTEFDRPVVHGGTTASDRLASWVFRQLRRLRASTQDPES